MDQLVDKVEKDAERVEPKDNYDGPRNAAELASITSDPSRSIGSKIDAALKYQHYLRSLRWNNYVRATPSWGLRSPSDTGWSSPFVIRIPSTVDYSASQVKFQQQKQAALQTMQAISAVMGAMAQAKASQASEGTFDSREGYHIPGTCGKK